MASPSHISRSMIRPSPLPESTNSHHCHLNPWGLACLATQYVQWGLLFSNASGEQVIDHLKTSLTATLSHFHLLAGRLQTVRKDGGIFVFVDFNKGEGVEFIHASARYVTVAEMANDEVPSFIRSFFPLNGAVGYDGHSLPFFAVQATELADGIFLGCSFNHAVGDGASFMDFLATWAEICKEGGDGKKGECMPIYDPWLAEDVTLPIKLPFASPDEFIDRFSPPPELRERMFHLSSQSIAQLKLQANNECNSNNEISSFQALCSLIWRALTRVRRFPPQQNTSCRIAANNRPRMCPSLPIEYFGCAVVFIRVNTTVGELLNHDLGWGAMLVHQSIVAHTDRVICEAARAWTMVPVMNPPTGFDPYGITIASSPRFDLYGCDFGWGKAAALRSGAATKYDGKVAMYMGAEGKGSVDLEINLVAEAMAALDSDKEFMSVVSA